MGWIKTIVKGVALIGVGYFAAFYQVSYSMRVSPNDWADALIEIKNEQKQSTTQNPYPQTD